MEKIFYADLTWPIKVGTFDENTLEAGDGIRGSLSPLRVGLPSGHWSL